MLPPVTVISAGLRHADSLIMDRGTMIWTDPMPARSSLSWRSGRARWQRGWASTMGVELDGLIDLSDASRASPAARRHRLEE